MGRGQIIITTKNDSNVLSNNVLKAVVDIDSLVKDFKVIDESGHAFSYKNVCMKWDGDCLQTNPLIDMAKNYLKDGMDIGQGNITYPTYLIPTEHGVKIPIYLGSQLLKVELINATNVIKTAKGLHMMYPLGSLNKNAKMNSLWEDQFEEHMWNISRTSANFLQIVPATSRSLVKEANGATTSVLPRFALTICLLVIFSVLCMMTTDWVLSKPFLAFGGVLSATFAVITAVGVLSTLGLQFIQIVSMMPFLIIGVGIDNMFIMVTTWRQCNQQLSIDDRMAKTLSDAAVSITITNLTDVVAFLIGAVSPLAGMRIFCIYAGVAIAFAYIYQITFFAACLAVSGVREEQGRHGVTCRRVVAKEQSPIFCDGGVPKDPALSSQRHHTHKYLLVIFFEKYYGPFVMHRYVRTATIMTIICMLAGAMYGCTQIKQGLSLHNLARDNSSAWKYYRKSNELEAFKPTINIIFTDKLKYWRIDEQEKIEQITRSFEESHFTFSANETESWLRAFTNYLSNNNDTRVMSKCEFMKKLEEFLNDRRYKKFKLDIVFNDDASQRKSIKASRLLMPSYGMKDSAAEKDLMLNMRQKAENSVYNVTAYAPIFVATEQYQNVLQYTLQILCYAILGMLFVTLIMIPHPLCSLWIILCAISIDVCVIGYMSLWGISLDILSMINLVLCIGFSVDFSAHIAYAFMTSPEEGTKRGIHALTKLGTPILQGGLSSIIAIFPLQSASVYIFRTFFKTLFLVMSMGLLHGLLVLPVILTQLQKFIPQTQYDAMNSDSTSYYPNSSVPTTYHPTLSNDVDETPTEEEEVVEMRVSSI
ncbi:Patched domain-containing protein 3 [Holothuria leucospilota]|uniref:Patched domain-containing protein 3 n=1 Tax=Holothuria leucospilota TaxID=206669 RepID=A0A9Q1BGP2_HOLLE|nr:Patched domain-containing protein 3 [Holothuria leucospilota]